MKLLIYSHAFAPQVGGIETFTERLATSLSENLADAGAESFSVNVVTQTADIGTSGSRQFPFEVWRRPGFFRLWRLIGGADKILLAGPAILPLLFARLRGKYVVATHHGYQAICPNGMLFQFATQTNCPGHFGAGRYRECLRCNAPQEGRVRSWKLLLLTFVRRALVRRASVNVGVSEHVAQRLAMPRLQVIRNGVPDGGDSTKSDGVATAAEQETRFAYVGRLVAEKGVKILLEAAALLARNSLTPPIMIIGDGPERPALEQQKALLGLGENVAFLGFLRGPALEEKLRQVSVVVMPALYEDIAPFSVLEMMMQGKLIICSRIGGIAEQVGKTGMTFSAGNSEELAERMRDVLLSPTAIEILGRSARERAISNYSLQRMIDQYRKLLEAIAPPR